VGRLGGEHSARGWRHRAVGSEIDGAHLGAELELSAGCGVGRSSGEAASERWGEAACGPVGTGAGGGLVTCGWRGVKPDTVEEAQQREQRRIKEGGSVGGHAEERRRGYGSTTWR
jgi:hypothetical protein